MIKPMHLKTYRLQLTALTPVFIGSGQSVTKRDYLFDPDAGQVSMVDLPRLTALLSELKLMDSYETYLLRQGQQADLQRFLQDNRALDMVRAQCVLYTFDGGNMVRSEKFREVQLFIKDAASGQAYIPGSSLKGALRTALLSYLMAIPAHRQGLAGSWLDARRAEGRLLHKIPWNEKINGIVSDVMRAVRISDSTLVPHSRLTLCGKADRHISGQHSDINLYRECIAPGTSVRLALTVEPRMLQTAQFPNLTPDGGVLRVFSWFEQHVLARFAASFPGNPLDAAEPQVKGFPVTLGAGTGYESKTITYAQLGFNAAATERVAALMQRQFPRGKHEQDAAQGVSPHTLKYTMYRGQYHRMGRCRLTYLCEE